VDTLEPKLDTSNLLVESTPRRCLFEVHGSRVERQRFHGLCRVELYIEPSSRIVRLYLGCIERTLLETSLHAQHPSIFAFRQPLSKHLLIIIKLEKNVAWLLIGGSPSYSRFPCPPAAVQHHPSKTFSKPQIRPFAIYLNYKCQALKFQEIFLCPFLRFLKKKRCMKLLN
jgi:hypothetical protein